MEPEETAISQRIEPKYKMLEKNKSYDSILKTGYILK